MATRNDTKPQDAAASLSRHIALLGKALGKDIALAHPVLTQPLAAEQGVDKGMDKGAEVAVEVPAARATRGSSALERLRAHARRAPATPTPGASTGPTAPAAANQPHGQPPSADPTPAAGEPPERQVAASKNPLQALREAAQREAQRESGQWRAPAPMPVIGPDGGDDEDDAHAHAFDPEELASRPAHRASDAPTTSAGRLTAPSALSAMERLRQKAQTLPPRRLERREDERQGEPLVPGGPRAPREYPSTEAWPDDLRPPGSRYSLQEWEVAARGSAEEGAPDEYAVMEVLAAAGSVLMRVPRAFTVRHVERMGKQVITREETRLTAGADPQQDAAKLFFGQTFDRCLIVLPDARPDFPGAIEPRRHRHGEHEFWVIRPRAHYLEVDSNESFLCNARWVSDTEEPDLRDAGPAPT